MATKDPIVSVIVPFYNVENYARRCLGSLLVQTYDSFEVICVDDGSTDGTAAVLDDYSRDYRVRVFRIENGGQSVARNYGVKQASGSLLTFVDADDFVSPIYLESLVAAYGACDRGFVLSSFLTVPDKSEPGVVDWPGKARCISVDKTCVVDAILYDEIPSAACGKLAPKSLYERVPFPEGHVYEDVMMAMDLVGDSDSFSLVEVPIYAYAMRTGSTVWDACPSDSKINDYLAAADMLPDKALAMFPDKLGPASYFRCLFYSRIHTACNKTCSRRAKEVDAIALKGLRRLVPEVLRDGRVKSAQKARFLMAGYFTKMYDVAYGIYVKKRKTGEVN